jgi:predicted porin
MYLLGAAVGLALAGATAQAQMKDPLPDSLSLGGVTFYATIDIGYAYQSAGAPLGSQLPGGLEYQAFTTTRNFSGSVSTIAESGLEQSKAGIRVSQPIGNDISLVARAETGFNPLSGQLTDACASIANNGGVGTPANPAGQTSNADSSRCGQLFQGPINGGFSSPTMGQLTVGRHNSVQLDALAQYDPQALSYAFSFLGYSGFNGGAGSTEAARWDNSVRYAYTTSDFRLVGMYSSGGLDTGVLGKAYGVDVGVTYEGFSVDATYENVNSAVNLRSSFDDGPNPLNPQPTPAEIAAGTSATPGLAAYISDDTSYNIMAKYTTAVGDPSSKDKFTVYAGYSHIQKAHGNYPPGGTAAGNYELNVGINVNNSAVYEMEWIGARYAMGSGLNMTAAFYHVSQNSWTIGLTPTGNQGIGCSAAGLLCSGDFTEASFVLDYIINKHYDIYGGVNYSQVTDGLAWGFANDQGGGGSGTTGSQSETTVMFGIRVRI